MILVKKISLSLGVFFLLFMMVKNLLTHSPINSLYIDPLCSASCNAILSTKLKALVDSGSLSESLTTIKNEFPLIDRIDITYQRSGYAHASITVHSPWFWINEYEIILANGTKVPSWWFNSDQLQELPKISFSNAITDILPTDYHTWLTCLSADVFNNYQIVIDAPHTIYLHAKKTDICSILCSTDRPLHNDVIAYCNNAYKMSQQKIGKAKSATQLIADVRFNQQIILYQKKGSEKDEGRRLF